MRFAHHFDSPPLSLWTFGLLSLDWLTFSSGYLCGVNGDHRLYSQLRATLFKSPRHHQNQTSCVLIFHTTGEETSHQVKGHFFLSFRSPRLTTPRGLGTERGVISLGHDFIKRYFAISSGIALHRSAGFPNGFWRSSRLRAGSVHFAKGRGTRDKVHETTDAILSVLIPYQQTFFPPNRFVNFPLFRSNFISATGASLLIQPERMRSLPTLCVGSSAETPIRALDQDAASTGMISVRRMAIRGYFLMFSQRTRRQICTDSQSYTC